MKTTKIVLLTLIIFLFISCEQNYGPFIMNIYEYDVKVKITYYDKTSTFEDVLPSFLIIPNRITPPKCKEIFVYLDDSEKIIYYSEEVLNKVRKLNQIEETKEWWLISEDGITLINNELQFNGVDEFKRFSKTLTYFHP